MIRAARLDKEFYEEVERDTGFVAIRQSLDQDDTNAALTMVVSFLVVLVLSVILSLIGGALGLAGAAITGAFTR